MERTCFKYPVAADFLHRKKQQDCFVVVFWGPSTFPTLLCSPSDTSVPGNFSTVTTVSLQISDPLPERTIATSSFNLILHPNPLPAEKPVPPISQGQTSGTTFA